MDKQEFLEEMQIELKTGRREDDNILVLISMIETGLEPV